MIPVKGKPKFSHDGTCCTFLGTVTLDGETFDLYHGQVGNIPTIIARFSNEGSDYTSGLESARDAYYGTLDLDRGWPVYIEAMGIAYGRAKARGLYLREEKGASAQ